MLINGQHIGRYQVLSAIGAGGMGEVYLAEDTRLDRKVALKILPPEFTEDSDRISRFVREAKSASALNHPNIITIYEIGEADGTHFIATEFIEGKTLHSRLQSKNLSVKSALDIAIQIVSALSAAHSANIIHRDIKPDNVMIRADGLVKLLDFGIAKLSEAVLPQAGSLNVDEEAATAIKPPSTSPGMIIGTANYMSPEQAKGKEIDARSDIFSFGIVLYEMLSGKRAFGGETPLEIISSILKDEPKQIHQLLPALPREIERIVGKTLRKDRDERYQTARDLLTDLKDAKQELEFQDKLERTSAPNREEPKTQIMTAPPTAEPQPATSSAEFITGEIKRHKFGATLASLIVLALIGVGVWFFFLRPSTENAPIDSIAVLPFENKTSDADAEYLSDGLAESLIYRLSQLPNLKVSPTSSVFRYKGKETDALKIGNELGVNAVMSGRIVKRGDSITISVELVDVRNNKLLWGEQYERKMSELLATQREIAAEIANKLQLKLSGEGEKMLTKQYTSDNEAYQFYLKGRYHYAKRTKDDILRGIEYFQQAIKLDPNFALAYVGVSESYSVMPFYGYLSPKEGFPQAKAAARRAIDIDPTLAEAHAALAEVTGFYERDWEKGVREYKRAIELNQNVPEIHFSYGFYLQQIGRSDEAIREGKRALEMEPLSIPFSAILVGAYINARQNDLALEQARKAYNLEPNHPAGRFWLGVAYIANGMYGEAIAMGEKALQNDPTNQDALYFTGYAYAKSGRRQDAEEVIKKFKDIAKTQYVVSYYVAAIYSALGDKDKAFAELEKSFAEGDSELSRLKVDPWMDGLRDDLRFKEMLKRLNLPE